MSSSRKPARPYRVLLEDHLQQAVPVVLYDPRPENRGQSCRLVPGCAETAQIRAVRDVHHPLQDVLPRGARVDVSDGGGIEPVRVGNLLAAFVCTGVIVVVVIVTTAAAAQEREGRQVSSSSSNTAAPYQAQLRHGSELRMLKDRAQAGAAGFADQLDGCYGIAAEAEEAVLHADPLGADVQQGRPQPAQGKLRLRRRLVGLLAAARGVVFDEMSKLLCREHGADLTKPPPLRERILGLARKRHRHPHEAAALRAEVHKLAAASRGEPEAVAVLENQEGGEQGPCLCLVVAAAAAAAAAARGGRDDLGGQLESAVLDLAEFHSLAPDLDLRVLPAHKVKTPVAGAVVDEIARLVETTAAASMVARGAQREECRVSDVRGGRLLGVVKIPRADDGPLEYQLPGGAEGHQDVVIVGVDDPRRTARARVERRGGRSIVVDDDGRAGDGAVRGALRGAVEIGDSDTGVQPPLDVVSGQRLAHQPDGVEGGGRDPLPEDEPGDGGGEDRAGGLHGDEGASDVAFAVPVRGNEQRAAGGQHADGVVDRDVERVGREVAVSRSRAVAQPGELVMEGRGHAPMGYDGALGHAGAARGEDDIHGKRGVEAGGGGGGGGGRGAESEVSISGPTAKTVPESRRPSSCVAGEASRTEKLTCDTINRRRASGNAGSSSTNPAPASRTARKATTVHMDFSKQSGRTIPGPTPY
ncbi:hypothetical protein ColKHC_04417 [Colletotrichum higginsianum]|nr:hypothetical protein ColKHC_04417 [Colletotrichum higginsianum]